jgi:hypothetical protein
MNIIKMLQDKYIGDNTKPIIDKITLVAPSPNTIYKNSIKNGGNVNYEQLFLEQAFTATFDKAFAKSKKGGTYQFNAMIYLECNVHGFLLQMGPKNKNGKNPFIRIEFNPTKLGPNGMAELAANLISFMDTGFEYFWDHGKTTRIDIAVDLHGVKVGQVRFLNKWGTTERIIGTSGEIETIYVGKSTSSQTKIYNKAKEAKLPPEVVITRIERSIRTQVALKNLYKLLNKFEHLALADVLPAKPDNVEKYIWEMFSDSVEKRGPASALNLLPKEQRKLIVTHLKATACDFWNPTEIWCHWPAAVQPIIDAVGPVPAGKAA